MALILALIMLTLMSLLGALALSTSTSELGISSNYKSSQEAFYAAERGLEYATTSQAIYDHSLNDFPISLTNNDPSVDTADEANIAVGTGSRRSGLLDGAVNQVDYIGSGGLPPGSGSDPTYFQSRFYAIDVTGQGPANAAVRVQAQIARIVPK
jgi:PilX N-terminal